MTMEEQAVQVLTQCIKKALADLSSSLPFDRTVEGRIISVIGNNTYEVMIDGAVYTVPSAISDVFAVNDIVLVLYPQGNLKGKHIIGGKRR